MFEIDKVPGWCPVCGSCFRSGREALWDAHRLQYFFVGAVHKCKNCGEEFRYRAYDNKLANPSSAEGNGDLTVISPARRNTDFSSKEV